MSAAGLLQLLALWFGGCGMKKLTVASVGVMALAAAFKPAAAADTDLLYGPPPVVYAPAPAVVIFTWTGFYFGAHVGGAWAHKTETGFPYTFLGDQILPAPFSLDPSGWLAGGQIGANYQVGSLVYGAEADASGANLTGRGSCPSSSALTGAALTGNCDVKVVGLGTIAGRLGVAFDRLLVYGKAGGAWANDKYTLNATSTYTPPGAMGPLPPPSFGGSETRWGWMAGAGVEYAFYDNWSAKIEYNYLGFRHTNLQFTDTTGQFFFNTSVEQQMHVVKAGVSYRWGWYPVGIRY
jgi:outer membrane immunogenic protein